MEPLAQIEGRRPRRAITASLGLMRLPGMSCLDPFSRILPRLFPRGIRVRLRSGAALTMSMDHPFWLKVVRRGYQEMATERLLMAGLRPGDTLIDVGAHRGIFTVIGAQSVGETGRVYAFEPDPLHVRGLRTSIRLNGLANVTVEHCAVGETDAPAWFTRTRIGYERLPPPPGGGAGRSAPMVALDTYVRERAVGVVRMIKINVDGPELRVLEGGQRLLASPEPPLLVMELSRLGAAWGAGYRSVRAYLRPFGYGLYGCERTRGDLEALPPTGDLPWNLTTTTVTLAAVIPALHRGVLEEVLRLQSRPATLPKAPRQDGATEETGSPPAARAPRV